MEFGKELGLSFIAGLTWLSYNRPKFARKILYTLLVCCILAQAGLRVYQLGYKNCLTHIPDSHIIAALRNASSQIDNIIERYSFYLDIAEAILVVLVFFCISVDFSKKSDR